MEDIITSPEFAKVVTGLASLAGAIYGGIKLWLRRKEKKKESLIDGKNLIEVHLRVNTLLHDIRDLAESCRVTLVQCTNSGSIPVLGEPWHGSIVRDVRNVNLKNLNIADVFIEQPLDQHAIEILQKACVDGDIWMKTENLPSGVLKELYLTYGITHERTIFLTSEKGALWVLAINWLNNDPKKDREDTQEFKQALAELRTLIRVHKGLREEKRLKA